MTYLQGTISYNADPMVIAVRGMTTQMKILNVYTDNVAYADVPGYQKKQVVQTSFQEYLGPHGVSQAVNTEVGRLHMTEQPLDFALAEKGYFQKLAGNGKVELTRDGRFMLDQDGNLLSITKQPILSRHGTPIKLPPLPQGLSSETVKVDTEGWISVMNPKTYQLEKVAQLSVVSEDGSYADKVDVRQGYVEASNVFLHEEYVGIVPAKRNFQANRQIFLIQNQLLGRLVQEMGRAQ